MRPSKSSRCNRIASKEFPLKRRQCSLWEKVGIGSLQSGRSRLSAQGQFEPVSVRAQHRRADWQIRSGSSVAVRPFSVNGGAKLTAT